MSELIGIVRFTFYEGRVGEYKRLAAEARDIVRAKDPGTLEYTVYFNEDESECVVIERYRDSDALIEHAANTSHLMDPILATGTVSGEVLGEPSDELRARLADSPVGLYTPWLTL